MNNAKKSKTIFVCATRLSEVDFMQKSLLARSLRSVGDLTPVTLKLFPENSHSLGKVYNQAIDEAASEDILVFIHDDVYLDDWRAVERIRAALIDFDLVGVAGNRRRLAGQMTWYLGPSAELGRSGQFDLEWLSGAVRHGSLDGHMSVFGDSPAEVCLLDGVLLASSAQTLLKSGLRFDPVLDFHFYDLDLCRTAQNLGLRIGTCALALTHESTGNSIASESWVRSQEAYCKKYKSL